MKPILILILLLAGLPGLIRTAGAQPYPVDTILQTGPRSERINLVILGDGFTARQQGRFQERSRSLAQTLMGQSPFSHYRRYFNLYGVFRASVDSGAKHPVTASDCPLGAPVQNPVTIYGSTFDYGGIHRLVVPTLASRIAATLAGSVPDYDLALVLVNSTIYGGSGGTYPTASLEFSAAEIVSHEVGHSFGYLADEYWAGSIYAGEYPNMTANGSTASVKWNPWLGYSQVGLYAYPEDPAWYRPHNLCKMRYLGFDYCPVCQEALVERIHGLVAPVSGFVAGGPARQVQADTCQSGIRLELGLIRPEPNTLRVRWQLSGQPIPGDSELTVPCGLLAGPGTTRVQAVVQDTTALVRVPGHSTGHVYLISWDVRRTTTGTLETIEQKHTLRFSLGPNPSQGRPVGLHIQTEKPIALLYRIVSATGVELWSAAGTTASGESSLKLPVDSLPFGLYQVQALHQGQVVWSGSLLRN